MKMNKALLNFHGQPMIQRVLQRLSALSDDIYITTNLPDEYLFLGIPTYEDEIQGKGAVGGMVTALRYAAHEIVAVLACDMPFVQPGLIQEQVRIAQAGNFDVVIPRNEKGLEPLHAVFRKETCLPAVIESLKTGNYRMTGWYPLVKVFEMSVNDMLTYDPNLVSFINVNTPQEFEHALQIDDGYFFGRFDELTLIDPPGM